MVDDTQKEQTPGSENPEAGKTETETTAKEQAAKTFSEEDLNRIIKERLDRERKKYSDYNDLKEAKKQLDEIQKAKLNDEERAARRVKELEEKAAELERDIKAKDFHNLKRSKLEQAIADGKIELPKGRTIDSLVKRMIGETEEDLDSDIEDLAGLFPKSKSLSGPSQTVSQPAQVPKSVKEEIEEIAAQIAKSTDIQERERLINRSISLKLKASGHIKGES